MEGGPASATRDEAFRQRARKQAIAENANGKNIIVVDMAGARQAMRAWFLAVGLFLSILLANSQQVIEHMKKVWKIRGEMEANQIVATPGQRRFILEFSEKGDKDHVVRGGPWQYRGDAFLAEGLEVGADPDTALFTHLPVWVQFRNIPFYLLTKKLARDLRDQVGTLLMIDEHSRGNICEKFLRVRVQLPLYLALQKTITLKDEITEEEVEVQLRYERIPNFCLFCGYVGHMEARCDTPLEGRKVCFSTELRVPPVLFEDPRTWFLPEAMGVQQPQAPSEAVWRAPNPAPWPAPWRGVMPERGVPRTSRTITQVEEVAAEVANLRVQDNNSITTDKQLLQASEGNGLDTNTMTITSTTAVVTHVLNIGDCELGGKGNINTKEADEQIVPPCIITGDTITENAIDNAVGQVLDNNNEPVPTSDQMANVVAHALDINSERALVVD
ncbi:hypothetical protein QYE76_039142 [Lolium multiflorum]|uniref:Zinc knuckle CX2CX4HX4C domain-containing protein n=1 Tax=Lolium multiflorum TaxID=4521 RepID=A0AAD8T938_LOLMU|nr:hypothetical protein QYE76_039142 [Lolium multiflorum]